jgi:ribosomal protein S12 methylthiotransferase accessory factor
LVTDAIAVDSTGTPKRYRGGTHRCVDPAETLERVRPWFGHVGITRVANVTGLDVIGLPVVMVTRPNSRSVAVSQGKGLTLDAARASGVMESLELWHAETATLPLRLGSERDLRERLEIIESSALPRTSTSTYDAAVPLLWTPARDLTSGRETWVPYECVHMNSCVPLPTGAGYFLSTSNGLASGNTTAEAVLHAICETIERDATTLWHALSRDAAAGRALDLQTVDDEACRDALERCRRAGVGVAAWDITTELGVAACACLIFDAGAPGDTRAAAVGYGCHSARGVALFRALSEAVQSRLTFIAGARDDIFRREYEDNVRTRLALDELRSGAERPTRSFGDLPTFDGPTAEADLTWVRGRMRAAGFDQVLVVELTDPRIAIPVVRVIVPGLEGPDSDEQYRPGARRRRASTLA